MLDYLFNSKKILSRSRYPWVDYARGLCIILVCLRHTFEGLAHVGVGSSAYPVLKYVNIFFFSFRMPLFFIVSGVFLGGSLSRNGVHDYVNKRFRNILYPLLLWGSIHITLQLIFAPYVHAQREPLDYLYLIIRPRRIEQFWYLNALFFVGILYVVIKTYAKFKPWQQLILGVIFYAGASLIYKAGIQIGFLFDVLFFYMFFAIGDLMADFILNARNYKIFTSPITFAFILPAFAIVQYYFTDLNLSHGDDYFVQHEMPALFAAASLIGGAFIINLSFLFEKTDSLRFLRVIGFHSLYIYVMHLMITALTRIIFTRAFGIEYVPLIMTVSIILGIGVPIIFYNVTSRMGAWWLFSLNRPKAKISSEVHKPAFNMSIVAPKESVGNNG